jgi:hypothetical protein
VPANLGVNPSLTIAAMTERAMSSVPARSAAPAVEPLPYPHVVTVDGQRVAPAPANGHATHGATVPSRGGVAVLLALLPLLLMLFTVLKKR